MRTVVAFLTNLVVIVLTLVFGIVVIPSSTGGNAGQVLVVSMITIIIGVVLVIALPIGYLPTAAERGVVIAISLWSLIFALPFSFVYMRYYGEWLRCGHQPVTVNNFLTTAYYLPGDRGAGPDILNWYVCTEGDVPEGYHRAATGEPRPPTPIVASPRPTIEPTHTNVQQPCFGGRGRCLGG